MKLSSKKEKELYGAIHEEIMRVRIKVANLSNKELDDQIDGLLADLCYKAPETALNVFKPKNKTKN